MRHPLLRILAREVAQLRVVGVAEQRVVIERDLRVQRLDLPVRRDDQRVDLDQRRLLGDERVVQLRQQCTDRTHDVGVDTGLIGEPAPVKVLKAEQRVDVQTRKRIGVLRRHRLDVHAALGREHHQRRLGAAIEHNRRVVLRRDLGRTLDPDLVNSQPTDVHPQDRLPHCTRGPASSSLAILMPPSLPRPPICT